MIHIPDNLITRQRYLNAVKPFMRTNLVKVFTGQRRVGKSYLMFQIMNEIIRAGETNIIYINKEDLDFGHINTAKDLHDYVKSHKQHQGINYVFIDEIQDIVNFEDALRSLILDKELDIYCSGSNANLMSSDIAGKLSGRYIEIKVYSLSYLEFLEFHQLENTDDSLELYMKYGGMPFLRNLPLKDETVFEYLKNIYNTIVYRDIVNKFAIRNTPFLDNLVLFLSSNTGSLFSANKISEYLKSQKVNIPPNQVQLYISHLSDAYIILTAKRYNLKGKRLFEIGEKYYFENIGIRNAMWGYRLEDKGKIVENIVFNHLLYNEFVTHIGILDDKEIDFVAQKEGEIQYFQVALRLLEEKTIAREFGNLLAINDNYPKQVITLDKYTGNTVKGVEIIELREFLSNVY